MNAMPHQDHETDQAPRLRFATVAGPARDGFLAATGEGLRLTQRAAACLLAPEAGDRVLLAESAEGPCYILAVLERASQDPGTVGLAEGLTLTDGRGALRLDEDGVRIESGTRLALDAPEMTLAAENASITAKRLTLTGEILKTAFSAATRVLGALEESVGRLRQRIGRSWRAVEDSETAHVGRMRVTVEKSLRLESRDALIRADEDVRVDAAKIHLG